MGEVTPSVDRPGLDAIESEITVLCVDDDPASLDLARELLELDDRFEVATESSPSDALEQIDGVDGVVSDYEMPAMNGLEFFDAARERRPGLPFVLLTSYSRSEVGEPILVNDWTDYLSKGAVTDSLDLLHRRVGRLVDHRRIAELAERTLGPGVAIPEGIAIVDPAGEFAYAGESFARRFGFAREDLRGLSWESVVTADEQARLEATALPVVSEGWRWTGRCDVSRNGGETVTTRTVIAGLDDGSMVFAAPGVE